MSEKTEWEVVDAPQSAHKTDGSDYRSYGRAHSTQGPSPKNFMQAALGRWWQLKLLGAGMVAVAAFVLLLMIGGVLVLTVSIAAVVSLGMAKLVSWLRGKQIAHDTQLSPQRHQPRQP